MTTLGFVFDYPIPTVGEMCLFCLDDPMCYYLRLAEGSRRAFIATAEAVAERAIVPTISKYNMGEAEITSSVMRGINRDADNHLMYYCPQLFTSSSQRNGIGALVGKPYGDANVFAYTAIGAFNLFFNEAQISHTQSNYLGGKLVSTSFSIHPSSIGFIDEGENELFSQLSDEGTSVTVTKDDIDVRLFTGLSESKWSANPSARLRQEGYAWYKDGTKNATRWLYEMMHGLFDNLLTSMSPTILESTQNSPYSDYYDSWSRGNRPDFSDDIANSPRMNNAFRSALGVNYWETRTYESRASGPLWGTVTMRRPSLAMAIVQRMLYDIRHTVVRMSYKYLFSRKKEMKSQYYTVTFDGTEFKIEKNGDETSTTTAYDDSYTLDESVSTSGTAPIAVTVRWLAKAFAPTSASDVSSGSIWKAESELGIPFSSGNDVYVLATQITKGLQSGLVVDGWTVGHSEDAYSSATRVFVDDISDVAAQNWYPQKGVVDAGYISDVSMTFFERLTDEINHYNAEGWDKSSDTVHYLSAYTLSRDSGISVASWKEMVLQRGQLLVQNFSSKNDGELKLPKNKEGFGAGFISEARSVESGIKFIYKKSQSLHVTIGGTDYYAPYAVLVTKTDGTTETANIVYNLQEGYGSVSVVIASESFSLFEEEFRDEKKKHYYGDAVGCIKWNWKTF